MQISGIKITSPAPPKKPINKSNVQPKKTTTTTQSKKPLNTKNTPKPNDPKTVKQSNTKVQEKQTKKVQEKPKVEVQEESKTEVTNPQEDALKEKEQEVIKIEPFDITLRYNHYKDKFTVENGILSFAPVEEKYCFGFVYKGNYLPVLKVFATKEQIAPMTTGNAIQYSWPVSEGQIYGIEIREDEEQQSKRQKKAYKAPEQTKCELKKNARMEQLTQEMKQMGVKELGGQKHREMLEQRDLQDILFS